MERVNKKNISKENQAGILVGKCINRFPLNWGMVNTLRNFLRKQIALSKINSQELIAQMARLPKPSSASERIAYMPWAEFQVWRVKTLHDSGEEASLTKTEKMIFERAATLSDKRKMDQLL